MRRTGSAGRRPEPRTVALGAAVLLAAVVLLWGGDRLGRWGAANLLAHELQDATGSAVLPTVEVHGRFVLLQVLRGRYDDVTVTLRDVRSGPLRIESVEADLTGVRLSFHDVLLQQRDDVYIASAVQRARLGYDDLDRYLDATGRPVSLAPRSADDELRLAGTLQVLDQTVTASATAAVGPRAGALEVRPTGLETDAVLDPVAVLLLRQRFTFLVPLDLLPLGQQVTAVEVGPTGLVVGTSTEGVWVRR